MNRVKVWSVCIDLWYNILIEKNFLYFIVKSFKS